MSKENKTSDKAQSGNDFIADVSNSDLLKELRLKLIGMERFTDEYYNEDAKAGCKTIFDELKTGLIKNVSSIIANVPRVCVGRFINYKLK